MIDECICNVSEKDMYKAYKLFFGTFASEQRLRILNLLRSQMMNVSEIVKETRFEQSIVSHNLKRLMGCGFIIQEIDGKFRNYKLNKKTIGPILNLIDVHMKGHCLKIVKGMKGGKK